MKTNLKILVTFFVLGCGLNLVSQLNNDHQLNELKKEIPTKGSQQLVVTPKAAPEPINSTKKNENILKPSSNITATKVENENYEQGNFFLLAQQRKTEKLRDLLNKNPNYDLNKAMEKSYETEEYLENWAAKRKQAIEEIFANKIIQQGSSIKAVSCRSKHCRIELFYQNNEDINEASDALSKIISETKSELFVGSLDISNSQEKKEASIYLSDDASASLY